MTSPTFGQFVSEALEGDPVNGAGLAALLGQIETACKRIDAVVRRGALEASAVAAPAVVNVQGEVQKPLDVLTNEIFIDACEAGGQLCGMVSEELEAPYAIAPKHPRGPYLLVFDPLDGSSNVDVNVTVGSIFSILRAPDGVSDPKAEDFLQRGRRQFAAGYALYGPAAMLVITLGKGTHGFTLDPKAGEFILTHPGMRVPEATSEFAINASNARFWEPPINRYVGECVAGKTGRRGKDFNMRWVGSMVAEVHRILIRGGSYMYPRDSKDPAKPGRLRLMYEANPMAMIIEQAGGLATTGREAILDVAPTHIHQRAPVIVGSREEVERIVRYHGDHDAGEDEAFDAPLFKTRTLFRAN